VVAALNAPVGARDHVVAQVVEAEFRIGAVGDVRLVGGHLVVEAHAVLDQAHVHAQEAVDVGHPLAVALGQVVVDGDDMDVLAAERVEVAGERGHERLAFAGLHFGDLAVVQGHTADELHVEVAQADRATGRLAHGGEGFGQEFVELFTVVYTGTVFAGERTQLCVRALLHLRLEVVDMVDDGAVFFNLLALACR
jgi:hypothetical protein